MSFTADVKDELARCEPTCANCEKATLAALVRIEGTLTISGQRSLKLEIATETGSVARTAIRLLHSVFDLKTELTVRRSVLHKAHNYLISVPAQRQLPAALTELGVFAESGRSLEMGINPRLVEDSCCAAAYLRGAFLGGGFIADPRGDLHFELTCENRLLAEGLAGLMHRFDVGGRVTRRRNNYTVYLKGAEDIVSFLALVGAHRCALVMEDARVVKAVRNDVNRIVNAEVANQIRTNAAADEQIRNIRLIKDNAGFATLPPALREFCELRLAYPEASLRELGEMAKPPLSKSAMNHRVRRISELAAPYRKR